MGSLAIKIEPGKSSQSARSAVRPTSICHSPTVNSLLRTGRDGPQAKLRVNTPGDIFEQEADRVAEQVMRMPGPLSSPSAGGPSVKGHRLQPGPTIQRLCKSCAEDDESIQAKSADAGEPPSVSVATSRGIRSLHGGGKPLPDADRNFFEPRFGADFSGVRIHNDSQAQHLARSVNARAFTYGQNVVFAAGEFSPATIPGRSLLAHELTHVIQQEGRQTESVFRQDDPSIDDDFGEPHEGDDPDLGFESDQPSEEETLSDECSEEWELIEEGIGTLKNCLEAEALLWTAGDLASKADRLKEDKKKANDKHDELHNSKLEFEEDLPERQLEHDEKLAPLLEERNLLITGRDGAKAVYDQASAAVTEPHSNYWSKFQEISQEITQRNLFFDWLVTKGSAESLSLTEVLSLPLVILAYANQLEKIDNMLGEFQQISDELEKLVATEIEAWRVYRLEMDKVKEINDRIRILEDKDPTDQVKQLDSEIAVITEEIDRLTKDIEQAIDESGEARWNAEDAGTKCAEEGAFNGMNPVFVLEMHMSKCYDVSF